MRNTPQLEPDSKAGISLDRVLEELSELRLRVERLEKETFPYGQGDLARLPQKPRRGRRPKLETEELLRRRASLTSWLEQNWPRLALALRKAESARKPTIALAAIISAKKEGFSGVFQPPFYYTPFLFLDDLGRFLASGRFHGNPRTLAASMAGLPELGWKRSFDICTRFPDKTGCEFQAYRDYIKRNFPDRLRELDEAKTVSEVKIVLARSRTHDPIFLHLKEHPEQVKEWLEAGKPLATTRRSNR